VVLNNIKSSGGAGVVVTILDIICLSWCEIGAVVVDGLETMKLTDEGGSVVDAANELA
jgi:hypothetical protein